MPYKNKKRILNLLLFLTLCTITFSTENSKKIEKLIHRKLYIIMN